MIKSLLLFFLALTSCSPSYDYSNIEIREVIDGDTVRLGNGQLLRYIGVDTPEVRIRQSNKWVYKPQPFALEAKDFNKQLIEGKYVRVEFDIDKYDSYGRLLGYVFLDNIFVNAKLLEEGYAVLSTRPPNIKYVETFIELQKQARKEKKGLWGAYEVVDSKEAYKFIGQIRTVRGRVLSTYKSEKCVFLNFGQDWRKDFTVVIFNNSLKYFEDRGIDPVVFYKGKTIEVSGRIKEYNGPEIIVNFPEEITVESN